MRGVRSIHHRYVNFSEGDLGDRVALSYFVGSSSVLSGPGGQPHAIRTQSFEVAGVRGVRRGISRPPSPTRKNVRTTAREVRRVCRVR